MGNQNEMLVDPEIKKEINKEGYVGDFPEYGGRQGGGAVLIGKKEEMPQLLERLEKEGRAENLKTYIKMHREIVLPYDKMDSGIRNIISQNIGLVWFKSDEEICYIDKDGSVAEVVIDPTKISSLRDAFKEEWRGQADVYPVKSGYSMDGKDVQLSVKMCHQLMKKEFKDLGLNEVSRNENLPGWIRQEISSYNKKIESDLKDKKKKEFDL